VVLLTVPAPQMEAKIEAARPLIRPSEKGSGYSISVPVRNRGNIHARMSGTVEIRSESGQRLDRFELAAGRGFLLPGHERVFRSKGRINLPDGLYVARVRLTPQKFRRPMRKEFAFHIRNGEPSFGDISEELKKQMRRESAGFAVSPPELSVRTRAGGRRMRAVTLTNLTEEALPVKATVMEWQRAPDGRDLVTEQQLGHGRSGVDRVELRLEKFELRPRGRRRVPLILSLPRKMQGERYAAVCFDRADIQLDASPRSRARRSALVQLKARGTGRASAEISEFNARRLPNGAVRLEARLKNTGNVTAEPSVRFYLDDEYGDAEGRISPNPRPAPVQAGGEALIAGRWDKVLDPGKYTARVSVRYSQNSPPLAARTQLIVPNPHGINGTEE
jgi:hypothetical protein